MTTKIDELCVNTLRMLSADCVQQANSGHPGMPMGAAAMAYVLWTRFLKHNPANPQWPDRDRFVLSAGHGSMLLYSLIHLTGYNLPLDELKNFRQWGSKTPGHPEYSHTPGVETTTGPLGQGFAMGVGMAIAERFLAARFNKSDKKIIDHHTYGIVSDGDLMEGISHEAASLAGHLKLGKLVYLYDDNHISIEGNTDLTFTDNTVERFRAYGWHVEEIMNGNDLEAIEKAISRAREEKGKPSLIAVRTHIGYGSPNKQDTASAHGEPLGEEELKLTREKLGWPVDKPFFIPDEALENFRRALEKGKDMEDQWKSNMEEYGKLYPDLAKKFNSWISGELPDGWEQHIPFFEEGSKNIATRVTSGVVLNAAAQDIENLFGGSADLAPSNKTEIKGEDDFQGGNFTGRNIRFGVRELHGGIIPYGGTFLIFSDYMKPSIRLAALMGLKVIYVFTHDSIGLGEDGPTHQPIEQLASLRSIPNLIVIRPCDANETAEAWRFALKHKGGPVALALTRQGLPVLDRTKYTPASELPKGAYILKDAEGKKPDIIIIATGSEISIALESQKMLDENGVDARVVSMPSRELFEMQDERYRRSVLPPEARARLSVEAGSRQGWHRYLGSSGHAIGIDHFGASAPYLTLYKEFGITAERVVEKALELLKK
ncbi:transketolase [Thermodesulfobacteriota bacterium]